jgi:hypothetical protein
VPARSLRTAGLYCPAPPSRIRDLLAAYDHAEASSGRLASAMDQASLTARAPSQILALARAAEGRAAEPAAPAPDSGRRPVRDLAGPVARLLTERGITGTRLKAAAEELDHQIRDPDATRRQLVLRRDGARPARLAEPEAGS